MSQQLVTRGLIFLLRKDRHPRPGKLSGGKQLSIMTSNDSGGAANGLPSDSELASLAALLKEAEQSGDDADKNLAEVLARLESADLIARQMENNLNQLLEKLDEMVQGLEAAGQTEENSLPPDDAPVENIDTASRENEPSAEG